MRVKSAQLMENTAISNQTILSLGLTPDEYQRIIQQLGRKPNSTKTQTMRLKLLLKTALLTSLLVLSLGPFTPLFAQGSELSESPKPQFEYYSERPHILSVAPQEHPDLDNHWQKLKRGHLEATALILAMYTDYEIYFLARDTELLHDFAMLASRNNKAIQKRLHLLNVSRANMRAEHIKDYL